MTQEESKELKINDILSCPFDTVIQILKRISDGYLVLNYSPHHNNFNTAFMSFEDIINNEYEITDYYDEEFCGENIQHEDEFGYCKPI